MPLNWNDRSEDYDKIARLEKRVRELEAENARIRADAIRNRTTCPRAPQPVWSDGRYQGIITNPGAECGRVQELEAEVTRLDSDRIRAVTAINRMTAAAEDRDKVDALRERWRK